MDDRPIGFFDSGLGGLTCIPNVMEALPNERIIYFGDTARTPYGSKAISTIEVFSGQIADFLISREVKMIVIACNTVSATCIDYLQRRHPEIPILGIVMPAAMKVAESCTSKNRIGIIGTKVTIGSKAYSEIIDVMKNDLYVREKSCPAFVPLIEEGIIKNDIMDLTIRHYMDRFVLEHRLDTLVLGCTHYPLIRETIQRMYPMLEIIDPSVEVVNSIVTTLKERDIMAGEARFTNTFYASDLSENFINMIDRIFSDSSVRVEFKNLDFGSIDKGEYNE